MKPVHKLIIAIILLSSSVVRAQQVLPYVPNALKKPHTRVKFSPSDEMKLPKIKQAIFEARENKKMINDTTKVLVFGIGSTESLQLEKLTAAGSLCVSAILKPRLTTTLSFNYGAAGIKKENSDSVPLSLFYFPDLANIAFSAGFDLHTLGGALNPRVQWSLAGEGSIQRRNIEKDSVVYQFGIMNINIGPKFRWVYTNNNHTAVFTVSASYNHVRINRDNSDAFTSLFDDYQTPTDTPVKRYIHGISFMTSLQLDNAILFTRTYTDFNQSADLAFTVGIKAAAEFFSF